MASQNDSFYQQTQQVAKNAMPPYIAPEAFFAPDGPDHGTMQDLDIYRVKEVLDTVDTSEPPLMPG